MPARGVFSCYLAILACDRRSRQPLIRPSSEQRGTCRLNDVRYAAKIGAANCADHRPLVSEDSSNLGTPNLLDVVTVPLIDHK
jgi:hypothetical protein